MKSDKIRKFLKLAGHELPAGIDASDLAKRKLGAQLLLSELIEYIVKGLKIVPTYQGVSIIDPEGFIYNESGNPEPDVLEMLDGLADVAYTMYWNSEAFGLPLEDAFDLVCDNNLEKFVRLDEWTRGEISLTGREMDCGRGLSWPAEVVLVEVKLVNDEYFAVGKDARGKVRKPACYKAVNLEELAGV